MREWTLFYDVRPDFTLNKERGVHHMKRAKIVKEWRDAYCELAQNEMIPHQPVIIVRFSYRLIFLIASS